MQHPNRTEPEIAEKKSVTHLATSSPTDTEACQGRGRNKSIGKTGGCSRGWWWSPGSFQGQASGSRSRLQRGYWQTHQDGCNHEALGGDLGVHHELGAMALTLVEAVEAVGKDGRCAQAAYGYHWVLASFAKKRPWSFPNCSRHWG